MATARCPSDLALEGYLLDGGPARLGAHLSSCSSCAARLERMRAEGQSFLQYVYPATVERVQAEASRPAGIAAAPWGRALLARLLPGRRLLHLSAAAALAVAILAAPSAWSSLHSPSDDYVGVKGARESLGLTVFLGTAQGARPVADGEVVPSTSALRFKVVPSQACHLWLFSLDDAAQLSLLYPAARDQGAPIARAGPLPGGAVLDGVAGRERIFAVCTLAPMPYARLEEAVHRAFPRGEADARALGVVPGMPEGTVQSSVLVKKMP